VNDRIIPFAALCRRLTDGNPLLLVELARGIATAGIVPNSDGVHVLQRTPRPRPRAALTPNVALRLHRLGPDALGVARAIAVLDTHATPKRVAALAGLDAGATAAGMQQLTGDRLITTEPIIDFAHPLVRTAAYEGLRPPTRAAWHAAAARVLAAEHLDPDSIAGHVLLAEPSGNPTFVARLRDAARLALARAAPTTASKYLARALAEPPLPEDRAEVLMELGHAELASAPQDAVAHFREALATTGTTDEAVAARLGLAQALSRTARFADAVDFLQEQLQAVDSSEPALGDSLLAALLNAARWDADARQRSRPFVEKLLGREDEPLTPELHANMALELMALGKDREGARRHAEAALVNAEIASQYDALWLAMVLTPLAVGGAERRALEVSNQITKWARARGQRMVLSLALSGNAWLRLWIGEVRDAIVDGEDALSYADDPISECFGTIFLAQAYMVRWGSVTAARG
jgi:tetratricopeptide (TPR) repeat protein